MSALSRAHASLTNAVTELEAAIEEAPAYSVESLRFLRSEIRESIRRLANARKVLSDVDPEPPAVA